jgi:hypothetical protein
VVAGFRLLNVNVLLPVELYVSIAVVGELEVPPNSFTVPVGGLPKEVVPYVKLTESLDTLSTLTVGVAGATANAEAGTKTSVVGSVLYVPP